MKDSRLSGFYRRPIGERIDTLRKRGFLSAGDADALKSGRHLLSVRVADKMIENVVATFSLPLGIAPNMRVNGVDYVVPMVVEEPSVVAALSSAAQVARGSGGFEATLEESLAIGQIHITALDDPARAIATLQTASDDLLEAANRVHPRLAQRGGGVRDLELRELELDDGSGAVVVHLLVDTRDAMGANLVNTICETLAPGIARLTGGHVALRILSNLVDRSLVTARCRIDLSSLDRDPEAAERARDGVVTASRLAAADPYRAATHNKGIMNGIDPLAIATGNDWRAIEAGAHSWAAAGGRYTTLSTWRVADDGALEGRITLPLKVGTVGGTLEANPAAAIGLRIAGVDGAGELAMLMAACGLAQNFSALRALGTTGIQHGHMRLHARSVAAAAGVPDVLFDEIVAELVASGDIKDWKARELLAERRESAEAPTGSVAAGKIILFGEHAVVYGRRAVALPLAGAVTAAARPSATSRVVVPDWSIDEEIAPGSTAGRAISLIAAELGIREKPFELFVRSALPRGMGLGSSAAFAVAVVRALAELSDVDIDDEGVNRIAYECEKLAHGTPSGIDNTIATFATPLVFRRGEPLEIETLELGEAPPILVASSNSPGSTYEEVARVRQRHEALPGRYDAIFDEIDAIAADGVTALGRADYDTLGALMNICQGLLNSIEVSTPELEYMVQIARDSGAVGAKLTGAGGGGSIIALCPDSREPVALALAAAGFRVIDVEGNGRSWGSASE